MTNILIAAPLYPPEIGGPATYVKMIENEAPKGGIQPIVVPFSTVRHLPKGIRHIAYTYALMKQVRGCKVIYALDPISVGVPAFIASKLSRKPLMVRLGGDYAWEQGQQRFGLTAMLDEYTANPKVASLPVRVLAWLQSFVVRRAIAVIVPSNYLKSIVMHWGPRDERVHVIHSALFPLPVSESKETLRHELGYTAPTILSAGRLVPWKGFRALIDATAILKETELAIQLIIAGDGTDEEVLKKYVAQCELSDNVHFAGRLSKDALGKAKKAADVFVLNTAYEGLSHELLEVMHLGTPIVTTNVGGNPELLKNGVSGILVDFDDTKALAEGVARLLKNESLRQSQTQHARARTQAFTQELVSAQFVERLKQIINC